MMKCVRSSLLIWIWPSVYPDEELTKELLLVEKESYERIIRMMSHEVNNSMGAIGATTTCGNGDSPSENKEEWTEVATVTDAAYERCGKLFRVLLEIYPSDPFTPTQPQAWFP